MEFDHLVNPETSELINQFVSHVSKTRDDRAKEARKGKKSTTELKVFMAGNDGFSPERTEELVNEVLQDEDLNENPRDFFEEHHFSSTQLNEEAYHLTITTPKYERSDDFLLIQSNGYLKALSIARRKWSKETIEKFIQYIDSLERLFITSDDLEDVVMPNSDRELTGFTAKYRPFYKDERVSVQVHGGSRNHLEDVERSFSARPKRIEFDQVATSSNNVARQDGGDGGNSAGVVKASVRQDGYASIPQVNAGAEDVGVKTIESVISAYEETNEQKFEVEHRPERVKSSDLSQLDLEDFEEEGPGESKQSDGGLPEELKSLDVGSVLEGVTIWHFEEEMPGEDYPTDRAAADLLESEILDYKERYSYAEVADCNFLIYDRKCGEAFEVVLSDMQMRVYAKSNTTSTSFREFYNILDVDFNSTYSFDKESERLRA